LASGMLADVGVAEGSVFVPLVMGAKGEGLSNETNVWPLSVFRSLPREGV
jgi:hypothetical protein